MTNADSLAMRVQCAIALEYGSGPAEARAAICAVADWLASSGSHCLADAARVLRREVDCIAPSNAIE